MYLNELQQQTTELKQQLIAWKEEFTEFRKSFYFANFYSVKQCLILQRFLYKVFYEETFPEISSEIYNLLRCISSSVTETKIKESCLSSHGDRAQKNQTERSSSTKESLFTKFSRKEIDKYLDLMIEEDVGEEIALASLMVAEDISENGCGNALLWCLDMMECGDDDEIEDLCEKAKLELQRQHENKM